MQVKVLKPLTNAQLSPKNVPNLYKTMLPEQNLTCNKSPFSSPDKAHRVGNKSGEDGL